MENRLQRLLTAYRLKEEHRTGWVEKGIDLAEDVAAHSWGTAFLCLIYGPDEDIDIDRAIRLALVHDLAEAETGDISAQHSDNREMDRDEKHRLEEQAMQELAGEELGKVQQLWEEYEQRDSPEARFVKDMDMVDMCLQAIKYIQDGKVAAGEMDEFFTTTRQNITTDTGRQVLEQLEQLYRELQE